MRLARMQMRAAGLADQAKYHARRACARGSSQARTTFLCIIVTTSEEEVQRQVHFTASLIAPK